MFHARAQVYTRGSARQFHRPPPVNRARRVFAPTAGFTILALALMALFARLGFWQWHRGVDRQEQWDRFARGADQVLTLGTRDVTGVPLFQRVTVTGRLDSAHQFLLDNRTFQGRAGYEVLTPLAREGVPLLLVDRGWVPFTGSRARLPDVGFDAPASVTLTGRIGTLPSPGLAIGRAPPPPGSRWPKVTSYPDMPQLVTALGVPLAPRILLLDPAAPFGYERAWQAPGLPPLRHFSYAIQWWSFAALTLIVWAVLSRRTRGGAASP
jgi:surfeit locus 1 family protein